MIVSSSRAFHSGERLRWIGTRLIRWGHAVDMIELSPVGRRARLSVVVVDPFG